MKSERLILVAELLSAFAVVATLIVLIAETREGNRLARISSYQEIMWEFNQWRRDLLAKPQLLMLADAVFRRGEYPERETQEGTELNAVMLTTFNTWNVAFLSYEAKIIQQSEWQRLTRLICSVSRSLPDGYKRDIEPQLTDDFRSYIKENC